MAGKKGASGAPLENKNAEKPAGKRGVSAGRISAEAYDLALKKAGGETKHLRKIIESAIERYCVD